MILNDPKTPVKFQPEENVEIFYWLKVPTVSDRVRFKHAVRAEGGKVWSEIQMLDMLEQGIRAVLNEEEDQYKVEEYVADIIAHKKQIESVLADYRQGPAEGVDVNLMEYLQDLSARMVAPKKIKEIERIILEHYEPYASMVADREVYMEISGLVAARMFLVGWEGINTPFKRTRMGVSDEMLMNVPPVHLSLMGAHIQSLMEPEVGRLKNLASRSGMRGDQDRSNGSQMPQENDPSSMTSGSAQN